MKIKKAVEGYIIDCRTRARSEKTIVWYEQKLRSLVRWLEEEEDVTSLGEVTIHSLRSFVLYIQTEPVGRRAVNKNGGNAINISPLTIKGYVQVVKGFFTWCCDEELLEKNPAYRLKLPAVPDYMIATFSPEHIDSMLSVCDLSTTLGYRNSTIILFLLETGVRVSELCGLRLQDIYEDHIQVIGKGKKQREIGISPQVAKRLWKYVNHYRKPADDDEQRVFINRYGKPVTPNGVEQLLIDIKNAAGVTGVRVSAHTFRHTFARMFLENGGEIYKLSRLLGHSSVEVTEEYLKDFNIRAARLDQNKFSPVNKLDLLSRRKKSNRRIN